MNTRRRVAVFITAVLLPIGLLAGISATQSTASSIGEPDVTTHGEWVKYAGPGGDTVMAYIAFPERRDAAPAMIVIHEIFGMSDWIRSVADDFAAKGYVAIAPDLLSRRGGTESVEDVRMAIRDLPPDSITVDLDATVAYLQSLRSVRGDAIGVIGFCWGGRQSFRYATNNPNLKAAVVCYGSAPDLAALEGIQAAVLGVYAENDARINANLPEVAARMQELGKPYPYTIYPGAGHAFLRRGEPAPEVERAWSDIFRFVRQEVGR